MKLIVILENTDNIVSRFNFVIEDCDNGPVITPAKELELSIDPDVPEQEEFFISANVQDQEAEFQCRAVLYDNEDNKLDQKEFTFKASSESARIVSIDGVTQEGDSIILIAGGDQCTDTSLLHFEYNFGRKCWDKLVYLAVIIVAIILLLYLSICHCLPCKIAKCLMWCCTCCCKSIKKRHDKAEAKAKKKELKEKEIELDRKLAKINEADTDKAFTERKLVPVGAMSGSTLAAKESEEIAKLRKKLKKEKKQRLQAENELKFNQTIQSARGGGTRSVFDLDYSIQGGGVYSSGTESSSEDSQAAKKAKKSKNKLKRVKSKSVKDVKVER